jgi:hypothetical protein
MVIALKQDGQIAVGITVSDSFIDMAEQDLALRENLPFWKVNGTKDCYVFAEDVSLSTDLLRYNSWIFKDITDGNSIVENVVPKMRELLERYSRVLNGSEWESQLLIIKGDKMYVIGRYFTVGEMDEMAGLGFEPYLLGGLEETDGLPLKERILFAARNLNEMRRRNVFPLTIFDNKTKKSTIYYQ